MLSNIDLDSINDDHIILPPTSKQKEEEHQIEQVKYRVPKWFNGKPKLNREILLKFCEIYYRNSHINNLVTLGELERELSDYKNIYNSFIKNCTEYPAEGQIRLYTKKT